MRRKILLLLVITFVMSCTKERKESIVDSDTHLITRYLKTTEAKMLVDQLPLWQSFSHKIDWEKEPEEAKYKNTSIKSIAFHLKNSDEKTRFHSLVIFYKDRKFIPVIVKGENINSYIDKISYFTPENIPYINFSIDNNRRISNYITFRKIPFKETFEERRFIGQAIFETAPTQSCLKSTDNFEDCAKCVIDEFSDSVLTSLGCMVFGTACAATIVVMCGGAQLIP